MTTRKILRDSARCLRTAAPPLVTLGMLTLARTTPARHLSSANVGELFLAGWRAAMIATLLWLLVAVAGAATRPLRDRRAFQKLQRLREIATPADRALVHVLTTGWSSTAGQHVVVVDVASGVTSRVWLPETSAPIGAFVVLERTNDGVKVVDWTGPCVVEAGHRHEMRRARSNAADEQQAELARKRQQREGAAELIRETEEFLRRQ